MKKEATIKFGSIYQFGLDYMKDFNNDADALLAVYDQYKEEIISSGHSKEWELWKESNQDLIIRLYDALKLENKIPSQNA